MFRFDEQVVIVTGICAGYGGCCYGKVRQD